MKAAAKSPCAGKSGSKAPQGKDPAPSTFSLPHHEIAPRCHSITKHDRQRVANGQGTTRATKRSRKTGESESGQGATYRVSVVAPAQETSSLRGNRSCCVGSLHACLDGPSILCRPGPSNQDILWVAIYTACKLVYFCKGRRLRAPS